MPRACPLHTCDCVIALRLRYFSHHAQSYLMRAIPTIPAVFAGNVPHLARRLAQDIPASQVLRKDWQSAICAVEARTPRYARARSVECRDCMLPAASTESGEMAVRSAVSGAAWAGMAAVRGACDTHGDVCDSVHAVALPGALCGVHPACVFCGFRTARGICRRRPIGAGLPSHVRALCSSGAHVLCACRVPYACYAPRTYSASLRFLRSSQSLRFPCP